ncbi:AsnC family protein [Ectobacillus funiculus]
MKDLGADTAATDVSRVFRLPYSINSRNGEQVKPYIWRALEYDLEELYSYCVPLEKKRKSKKTGTIEILPAQRGLKNLYSLNAARKDDLNRLVQLRNGDIEKRNVMIYIYSYTVALTLKNKEQTLHFARQLNDQFVDPDKISEVIRTAGRAYDDAMQFFDEFAKNGYKMWYKANDGIKRPMKTETIIEVLEITRDEIRDMKTVIDPTEKRERNTKRKRELRREQGMKERSEYLAEMKDQTEDKFWQLQKALERYPNAKQKDLAEYLGVDRSYISKLKKQLKEKM